MGTQISIFDTTRQKSGVCVRARCIAGSVLLQGRRNTSSRILPVNFYVQANTHTRNCSSGIQGTQRLDCLPGPVTFFRVRIICFPCFRCPLLLEKKCRQDQGRHPTTGRGRGGKGPDPTPPPRECLETSRRKGSTARARVSKC